MQLIPYFASFIYTKQFLIAFFLLIIGIFIILLPTTLLILRWKYKKRRVTQGNNKKIKVGIFHPYCSAGGGGEKVLWVALRALISRYPQMEFYVYTGDIELTPTEILDKIYKTLNVRIDKDQLNFVYLTKRQWLEPKRYPYFTLLGQAIGSVRLAFEAINKLNPDLFIETTGFTFVVPVFKYLGVCKTGCYIHYPLITKEMVRRVSGRRNIYNNPNWIARSAVFTYGKLIYYRIFAFLYTLAGRSADIILVNSTFTSEHLNALWNRPLHLVYPPCEVEHLKRLYKSKTRPDKIRILSLAQFRPEKDHPLQLQSLYELREIIPEKLFEQITLVLCGSCRNADDGVRVKDLKDLSKHLSLENNVEFKVNLTYDELLVEFENAYIGLHTMLDEHFGIGVVELMAAGLVVVAHRSGGPLLDIIETSEGSRLGYLAVSADEYAFYIKHILKMGDEEVNELRERARASVDRFSVDKFEEEFLRAIEPLFK